MSINTISSRVKSNYKKKLTHTTLRRLVQISFATFILIIAVIHFAGGESSTNLTASAEAFCPFGGLETLYKYLTSAGAYVPHTHLSNLVIAAAVLITALLLRSAFCGWICPLGFIQDLLRGLTRRLEKRYVPIRRFFRTLNQRGQPAWNFLDKYLRYAKYVVLVWAVTGAAIYGVMVFKDYDPWSALINITEWTFTPGIVVLAVTLVASLFIERPWCRYFCPLGAASGLLGKFSPVQIQRNADACTNCKICTKACPMGLDVHTATKITSPDCNSCLVCVDDCPREGALSVQIGFPVK